MKLKIAIVGSAGTGKTFVANILGAEGGSEVGKPPFYRPTHTVRIVEFSIPSLQLAKYSLDVDVQLWEVGDNQTAKSVWPGVQYGLDGVIVMYDVAKESSVREASAYFMQWVTHSPSGLHPTATLLIGNKFRGAAEHGAQRVMGVPPRTQHVALNIEDDAGRLREEVKSLIARVAQLAIDQEKANIITSGKFTQAEIRLVEDKRNKPAKSRAVVNVDLESF